jgi:hypothetical protein
MTPATDLARCINCDSWFAGSSVDEIFYHATSRCSRDDQQVADLQTPAEPRT